MDDFDRQFVRHRRAKVASYILIALAMIVGTALGVFAATWLKGL